MHQTQDKNKLLGKKENLGVTITFLHTLINFSNYKLG